MTEKLPRRSSRRVVVSSGSVHPTVTRVVSRSSSAGQASSSAPRGSPAVSAADVATAEQRVGAAPLPPFEAPRTVPGNNVQPIGSDGKPLDGSLTDPSDRANTRQSSERASPERLFSKRRSPKPPTPRQPSPKPPSAPEPPTPEQPTPAPQCRDRSPEQPRSEIVSTDLPDDSRTDGSILWLPSGRARALVVDDDPEIRRALARWLRPELDVHLAGSVAGAEALLERLDRVDVAFVDWELPDGTGEQILERLAHWPDAIRVLISGRVVSSENPLKNRALANLVLGKPLALGAVEALKRAALALPQD
jgi:CheY-like chemotaxis protein